MTNHNVKFWSVYERTKYNLTSTTNSLEGYHRHLNVYFITINPSLEQFGLELIIKNQLNSKKMLDSMKNYWTKKQKETNILKEEIFYIVSSFSTYFDIDYLKAIALHFNFPIQK
ncbi:hypothetical protein DMUE_5892 [Dictyocoela muelleri]|nr:hypothetical protein DMUE_5892 [Dictyocoela muelleri]